MENVFDVAIVGAGMIGSSCAKYISEDVAKCLLVGPKFCQEGIYGAWHDEGRITRKLDKNPIWRKLGTFAFGHA